MWNLINGTQISLPGLRKWHILSVGVFQVPERQFSKCATALWKTVEVNYFAISCHAPEPVRHFLSVYLWSSRTSWYWPHFAIVCSSPFSCPWPLMTNALLIGNLADPHLARVMKCTAGVVGSSRASGAADSKEILDSCETAQGYSIWGSTPPPRDLLWTHAKLLQEILQDASVNENILITARGVIAVTVVS